jgi:hypothetical protein
VIAVVSEYLVQHNQVWRVVVLLGQAEQAAAVVAVAILPLEDLVMHKQISEIEKEYNEEANIKPNSH